MPLARSKVSFPADRRMTPPEILSCSISCFMILLFSITILSRVVSIFFW